MVEIKAPFAVPVQPSEALQSPNPDLTGIPSPFIPAVTDSAVAHAIACANDAFVFITLSVVTFAELAGNVPLLGGATYTPPTVAGPFSRTD